MIQQLRAGYNSRDPRFDFKQPQSSSQVSIPPFPDDPKSSFGSPQAPERCACGQITHTHKTKTKIKVLKV